MLERAGARGIKLGRDILDAAAGDGDWDDVLPDLEKFLGTLNAPARHVDQAVRNWTDTAK